MILLLFYILVLLAGRQVGSSSTQAGTHPRTGNRSLRWTPGASWTRLSYTWAFALRWSGGSGLEADADGRLCCPFLLLVSKDFGITEAEAGARILFLLSGKD